jgi:hypothetical protein
MKTIFAVHHVFDCLGYNEHHYFTSFAEAFDRLTEIKNAMQEHLSIEEVYRDLQDDFYVLDANGLQRVYIEEINL